MRVKSRTVKNRLLSLLKGKAKINVLNIDDLAKELFVDDISSKTRLSWLM